MRKILQGGENNLIIFKKCENDWHFVLCTASLRQHVHSVILEQTGES